MSHNKFFVSMNAIDKTPDKSTMACQDRANYMLGQERSELSLDECIQDIQGERDREFVMMGWQASQVTDDTVEELSVAAHSDINKYNW